MQKRVDFANDCLVLAIEMCHNVQLKYLAPAHLIFLFEALHRVGPSLAGRVGKIFAKTERSICGLCLKIIHFPC